MSSLLCLIGSLLLLLVLLSSVVEARVYKKHYEFGRRIHNWKVAKVVKPQHHRHHGKVSIHTRVRPTRRHLLEKSMSNEEDFYPKIIIMSTSYSYKYTDKTTSSSSVNVRLTPSKMISSTSYYYSLPSAPMDNTKRENQAYASLSDMEGSTISNKNKTSFEIRSNIVVLIIVFGLLFVILFVYLLCRKKVEDKALNHDNHVV
mmetsp:Transcript_26283/g.37671  ORF Transcript_26283/g.37671 Transcript_26283/m.37671 type:complete len:202 (+) Transcript_26283:366-971(+)